MRVFLCCVLLAASPAFLWSAEVSTHQANRLAAVIRACIDSSNESGLEATIAKLVELDDPKVVKLIPAAAVGIPSARLYARGCEAIVALKNHDSVSALVKYLVDLKPRSHEQAIVILEAFSRRSDKVSLEATVSQLQHQVVSVQLTAIAASRARAEKESIPQLIVLLEKHAPLRDLTWLEARHALSSLTDHDFQSVEDWKKFWEGAKEEFDPKKVGEGTTKALTRVVTSRKKQETEAPEELVQFFGEEIFSRNVVFVIDVSGSMSAYDESDEYTGDNVATDRERLRRAKEQLKSALKRLPPPTRFNIISYGNFVRSWKGSLQTADSTNVKEAIKFVDAFRAAGMTHTDEAVKRAFEDRDVDTIVLLSDGVPMKATSSDVMALMEEILKWVRDHNASRKIRIKTFGFEGQGHLPGERRQPDIPLPPDHNPVAKFMSDLAEQNGGTYRPIK